MSAPIAPKTYNFKKQIPPPLVHEIYTTSEFDEEIIALAPDGGEETEVLEKKPKWLVRGELSSNTSVDDMLNLA